MRKVCYHNSEWINFCLYFVIYIVKFVSKTLSIHKIMFKKILCLRKVSYYIFYFLPNIVKKVIVIMSVLVENA